MPAARRPSAATPAHSDPRPRPARNSLGNPENRTSTCAGCAPCPEWSGHVAPRLLGDLDAPPALSAAIRFDAWLCSEAQRTGDGRISTTRVYRYGPGCVRDNKDMKEALALLAEHGRARLEEDGRRRFVVVNPALYRRVIG